jgi:O-antigen/teichoic acid export membrane protein
MSIIKKLAGETALYGLSSIIGRMLNYLLVPIYTRTLMPGEYGAVTEFYTYSGFLMVLLLFRMEGAFFRFGTDESDRDRVFSTVLKSVLMICGLFLSVILLFSDKIAVLLQYPENGNYIRWFGMILAFDAISEIPFARLRLEQRAKKFVTIKFVGIFVTIFLNLFLLLGCPFLIKNGGTTGQFIEKIYDSKNQISYIFLSNLIGSGTVLMILLPQISRISNQFDWDLWKKMFKYAWPLVIAGFAGIINEMFDRLIMPHILSGTFAENREQLGIYGANYKLAMLISIFTQAYRYAAEPFFFRQAKDKNAPQTMADACRYFTLVVSGAMLGVLLFMPILKNFVGEQFRGGLFIVPILLLANVFLGIFYNVSVWYRLKDKTEVGAKIGLAGALITVSLIFLLVPKIGFAGAAWATLVCYFFMAVATGVIGHRYLPIPYPVWRMAFYILSSLAVAGFAYFLELNFIKNKAILLTINSFLLIGWATFFYFLEKKRAKI